MTTSVPTLHNLTLGERLVLARRRRAADEARRPMTQEELATRLRLTRRRVQQLERDHWEGDVGRLVQAFAATIDELKIHEKCYIMRRREGLSQATIARRVKRSRYWVERMELGWQNCDVLAECWGF